MSEPGHTILDGEVELGPIAHGGYCVARWQGRVVFVRGGLPGERVRVALTDDSRRSHWFGRVDEVVTASPHRVDPPCPVAGQCGGCDFQHVDLTHQRELKRRVVAEQLAHLAGIEWDGTVEEVAGAPDGLGWRTRMHYRGAGGRPALRRHRSHELVEVPEEGCPIAHPQGRTAAETACRGGGQDVLVTVAAASGDTPVTSVVVDGHLVAGETPVCEEVGGRRWKVGVDGFWQVHPGAAQTLGDAVLGGLEPRPGERALDLYCGVGLFAGLLADAGAQVQGVEVSRQAVALARRNVPGARFMAARVERAMERLPRRTGIVVLDPPRRGAGRKVVEAVAATSPRAVAHVACDPAALGRDLGLFAESGYRAVEVRAFDLFPMTHHVECVAILERQV